MAAEQIQNVDDVVTFLKVQHDQVKELFTQVGKTSGKAREEAFYDLRRLLAVHETAEEEIVHPRVQQALADDDVTVKNRLAEENSAKEALTELEKLDVDSTEFEEKFRTLERDVIAHAEAEEREEFGWLKAELEEHQLQTMKKAVQRAEAMAPTRPHPGVESRRANLVAGPFAAMLDRARDAIRGKG